MKTHLIDSNVILRFLTRAPESQAKQASVFFRQCEQGIVTLKIPSIVIAEVVFVLTGDDYDLPRELVAEQLSIFLSTPSFNIEDLEITLLALEIFSSSSIDFIDAYLKATAEIANYTLTSFDKDLGSSRDLTFSRFPKIRPISSHPQAG